MSTISSVVISELRDHLAEGVRRARAANQEIIVSYISPFPDFSPLDAFAAASELHGRRWYWRSPEEDLEVAGIGAAHEINANGHARFDDVWREWQRLIAERVLLTDLGNDDAGSYHRGVGPQLFGGFSFRTARPGGESRTTWGNFPDAGFILPEVMFGRKDGQTWLTINQPVNGATAPAALAERIERTINRLAMAPNEVEIKNGSYAPSVLKVVESDRTAWMESVRAVVEAIRRGRFDKAVLARSIRVEAPTPFDAARILRELSREYPMCYRFAIQIGEKCFVGSTPELLAARNGKSIHSMALAGSAPRGRTALDDARLGASLLTDEKNLGEHGLVVDSVRAALLPICDELSMPEKPGLFKLPNVQHLYTPCTGRLRAQLSILDIVRRLHPTPAVGGHPLRPALECIAEHEALDRGWYAGPIGMVDASGDGAFAVAIRSALLSGDQAELFAGCGIVEGSDPEVEFEESRLKLVPILSSLERSEAW